MDHGLRNRKIMKTKEHGSVGIVETQTTQIGLPPGGFDLDCGESLPELTVAYETYGALSPKRDNVVYICHALTGDAHVAGYHSSADKQPGWWDEMVGPGKGIDTDYYFVVCANILGGCHGTTGPSSISPSTGKAYGSVFPDITVSDIVRAQKLLLEHLEIERLAVVIGGSLGGMQALDWSIQYPDLVDRCICVASGASLSAQALAFDLVARDAILSDPNWAGGDYYEQEAKPTWGLSHARKIGHITYLSPESMQKKFGREKNTESGDTAGDHSRFQVESYLDYQGRKLVDRFDANSYLRVTQAMDTYDLVEKYGSLEKAFADVRSKFLVIALSSDWLFPPEQSVNLANALLGAGRQVSCCTLQAPYGHDAFLIDIEHLTDTVRAFLPWVSPEAEDRSETKTEAPAETFVYELIRNAVEPGSRVLDLGCGAGDLLSILTAEKQTSGLGVDIDLENVIRVIDKGHDVFQGDIDAGLAMIPDNAYDYAIFSDTLQVVRRPRFALREMLRVAKEGIVSFPNSGKWSHRLRFGFSGRTPQTGTSPSDWYNTPDIHMFTLKDFVEICRRDNIRILNMTSIPAGCISRILVGIGLCNLGADQVLARIARH